MTPSGQEHFVCVKGSHNDMHQCCLPIPSNCVAVLRCVMFLFRYLCFAFFCIVVSPLWSSAMKKLDFRTVCVKRQRYFQKYRIENHNKIFSDIPRFLFIKRKDVIVAPSIKSYIGPFRATSSILTLLELHQRKVLLFLYLNRKYRHVYVKRSQQTF